MNQDVVSQLLKLLSASQSFGTSQGNYNVSDTLSNILDWLSGGFGDEEEDELDPNKGREKKNPEQDKPTYSSSGTYAPPVSNSTTASMSNQARYDSGERFEWTDQFPDDGSALDASISSSEAASICGPLLLYDFQRKMGRNPTKGEAYSLRQTLDVAKQNGWTVDGGMNGMGNLERTAKAMGMDLSFDYTPTEQELISYMTGGDGRVAGLSGNKHYWGVSQYDPSRGFYVGDTGLAMRKYGGKEWMTWAELMAADALDGMILGNY